MKRANGGAVYSGAGSNVVKEAEEKEQHKAGGKVVGKVMGSKPMKRLDKRARGGRIDLKQDKKMVSSAVHKHEKNMHKGENETKLKSGGKVGSDKSPFAPESARRPFSSASR
jgi:hypothetical protein